MSGRGHLFIIQTEIFKALFRDQTKDSKRKEHSRLK